MDGWMDDGEEQSVVYDVSSWDGGVRARGSLSLAPPPRRRRRRRRRRRKKKDVRLLTVRASPPPPSRRPAE